MAKQPTPIALSLDDRQKLRAWIKDAADVQLKAQRARIILLAAEQRSTNQIARALGVRSARVSKWRTRFAAYGLAGLENVAKPGKPRQYGETIDSRILFLVEQPPPPGVVVWTGPLLARALGNVSIDYVWKVLRRNGIKLRRHNPLEVETRSLFGTKLTSLIAVYLSSRASAFLIGAHDPAAGGSIAPARSFVRAANSEAAAHLRQTVRAGSLTLLDALQGAVALAERNLYTSRSVRTLDDFLADARSWWSLCEIHAFVLGTPRRSHPELRLIPLSTSATFQECLSSCLTLLSIEGAEPVAKLLGAAGQFVFAQSTGAQAPFEWHTRIPVTAMPPADAEDQE